MIKYLTLSLLEAIRQNGSTSIFWGGLIEQVVSPIPSPLVPMFGGFILIPKNLGLLPSLIRIALTVSLPYALGASIGSSFLYLLAFYGGKILVERFGKFFGLSIKNIDRFKNKFARGFKDELIIFFLIVLPITPISLVASSCGVIGISPLEYYPLILLGTFFRSLFLAWLGLRVGETYQLISLGLGKIENLLSVAALILIFSILAFFYYKRQKILKD